jgi:hypothetical protein
MSWVEGRSGMGFLWDFFGFLPPWALGLQAGFTIWMCVDAYQRGVEQFWFWVLIIFQPIGPWVYFFAVKLPRMRLTRNLSTGPLWQRRLSLDELRYRVERTPTVVNRLALAERLMDKKQHGEAIPHLEAILQMEETYCQAMHDLAVCHLETQKADQALPVLQRLMQRDPRWSDYRAWKTLIAVHESLGKREDALQACRELEKRVPTWENKCRLAEQLLDNGHQSDAAQILLQALEDHRFAPWQRRLRNWTWARHARKLLNEAEHR